MMSKKLLTGLFAAGLSIGMLAVSSTASAQYIGPTRIAPTTVNKVLKSPVDDQYVGNPPTKKVRTEVEFSR